MEGRLRCGCFNTALRGKRMIKGGGLWEERPRREKGGVGYKGDSIRYWKRQERGIECQEIK